MDTLIVKRPQKSLFVVSAVLGIWQTTQTFWRQLTQKEKSYTIAYPEESYAYSDCFRGLHVFHVSTSVSMPRCTACFLCATHCPAQAIHIEARELTDEERFRANDRHKVPTRFEIDIYRCIFCGFCAEVCPVGAITMGKTFNAASFSRSQPYILWISEKEIRPL